MYPFFLFFLIFLNRPNYLQIQKKCVPDIFSISLFLSPLYITEVPLDQGSLEHGTRPGSRKTIYWDKYQTEETHTPLAMTEGLLILYEGNAYKEPWSL